MFCIPYFGGQHGHVKYDRFFRRWCKLNVEPFRGQVKSRHFSERKDTRRQYFYFSYRFFGIIDAEQLGQPFQILTWIYYYLLNGTGLGLDLDNSCWIRKIPKFTTSNINIWFFTHQTQSDPELAKHDCITNCLIDNSSKFSYFYDSIPSWL